MCVADIEITGESVTAIITTTSSQNITGIFQFHIILTLSLYSTLHFSILYSIAICIN